MIKCAELQWVHKENSPEEVTELNLNWGRRSLPGGRGGAGWPSSWKEIQIPRWRSKKDLDTLGNTVTQVRISWRGRFRGSEAQVPKDLYTEAERAGLYPLTFSRLCHWFSPHDFPPDWIPEVLKTGSLSSPLFVFSHRCSSRQKGMHLSFGSLGFLAVFSLCGPGTFL